MPVCASTRGKLKTATVTGFILRTAAHGSSRPSDDYTSTVHRSPSNVVCCIIQDVREWGMYVVPRSMGFGR